MSRGKLVFVGLAITGLTIVVMTLYSTATSVEFKDLNGDGIWDDLEATLNEYNDSPEKRKAIHFYFRSMQEVILDPSLGAAIKQGARNKDYTRDHTRQSHACLMQLNDDRGAGIDKKMLKDKILSTIGRARAWLKFNKYLSGGVYSLWNPEKEGDPCQLPGEK